MHSPVLFTGRSTRLCPTFLTEAERTRLSTRHFLPRPKQGLKFNTIGGYIADDWKVSDRLTVSLNLRLENYANPTCDANCFSRLTTAFTGAPNPNAASTAYNQFIVSGQHSAYANTKAIVWEPRIGIAWRPFHSDKTVIRTGFGIFADELPGGLAEDAAFNAPGLNAFTVGNGTLAPGAAGSLFTTASQPIKLCFRNSKMAVASTPFPNRCPDSLPRPYSPSRIRSINRLTISGISKSSSQLGQKCC